MSDILNFEKSIARLEEIVNILEDGKCELDSAMDLFKEGIELSKNCEAQLKQAEQTVKILTEGNDTNV